MPSTRLQPRQLAGNAWRQWERFTVAGFRVNNKRHSTVQGFLAWFFLLVALYLLRWIAKKSKGNDDWVGSDSVKFWKGRNLFFCVSPGRSGSKHLRNVFDAAVDIRSFHEPEPSMTGNVLRSVLLQGLRAQSFQERADIKLSAIRNELEGTPLNVGYAETSHMFVKTFADVLLNRLGDVANITVVALHRPLTRVIWSQLRLGWFSPGHSGHRVWYYDVQELHESERKVSFNFNLTTAVDRLIGYNADILHREAELRQQIGKMQERGRWDSVRVVDVNIDDLSSPSEITQFLRNLGLRVDRQRIQLLSKQDDNTRELKKDRVAVDISIQDVERRVDSLANKLPILRQAFVAI